MTRRDDRYWMQRCLALAAKGEGATGSNPLVGAVIVKNGRKIAEGFHRRFGGPHAEIEAFRAADRRKGNVSGGTMYVSLEPCRHHGKTPPCVDEVIRRGIRRVVIPMTDPNPLVAGRSVRKLRRNGITCVVGMCREDAERQNERFLHWISTGRPFVALKIAMTKDAFIARKDGTSKWITSERSRTYAHRLRVRYDAVLVGAGTVLADDPSLTVRHVRGRNPVRVVLDGRLRSPLESSVFNGEAPTIVYTLRSAPQKRADALRKRGVTVVPVGKGKGVPMRQVMKDLARRGISSVLVEGGAAVYAQCLDAGLVSKLYLFTAPVRFRDGLSPFRALNVPRTFRRGRCRRLGPDLLEEWYPEQP
ncbi:MAG: bifunctional diaminohydroxyphosphoribosylaminopyrimidine deaminase/5-amino-6-(5-phosphoribosylamino)uracil reductase RibD [Bacteroidetes bacterium]|nr:MAG: bifunctional diaminohydroxyphosphoribosylaminopyrimidine deaminase/5-amino-6-(5-phosphoribosylamino)uracil reductase RibD [Bacteroidota bacterium]